MLTEEALRRAFPEGIVGEPAVLSVGTDGCTYLLDNGSDSFVYRRWARKPIEEVVHETSLLRYLSEREFPCPPPFVCTFVDADGMTNAVRSFVEGEVPLRLEASEISEIGRMLACLHESTRSVSLEGSIERYRLDDSCFLADLARSEPSLAPGIEQLCEHLARVDFQKLPTSVVHDDVSLENIVRLDNGSLVLIDWSESHFDYSIADIGAAAAQLQLDAAGIEVLLDGYRKAICPSEYEVSLVNIISLRRVLFLVWYYRGLLSKNPTPATKHQFEELLGRAHAGVSELTEHALCGKTC